MTDIPQDILVKLGDLAVAGYTNTPNEVAGFTIVADFDQYILDGLLPSSLAVEGFGETVYQSDIDPTVFIFVPRGTDGVSDIDDDLAVAFGPLVEPLLAPLKVILGPVLAPLISGDGVPDQFVAGSNV